MGLTSAQLFLVRHAAVSLLVLCCATAYADATTTTLPFNVSRGGGVYGPSVALDPGFPYYRQQPWADAMRKIHDSGFTAVQVVDTGSTATSVDDLRRIAEAARGANLVPVYRVFPATDFQAYCEHPEWRQKMLGRDDARHDWRVYLCPNQPEFVKFQSERVQRMMREAGYDHFQMAEPWFEQWGGPADEHGQPRAAYACVCDRCEAKFRGIAGVTARDMLTSTGSRWYWRRPENEALYGRWIDFRVQSIVELAESLMRTARKAKPQCTVNLMYLSDARVEKDRVREYQGVDLDRLVRELKPDIVTIQDAWQDWTRANLSPRFVADYGAAYVQRIRRLNPDVVVMSHADIGSLPASKRSAQWIRDFSQATLDAGMDAPSFYEWSVSRLTE